MLTGALSHIREYNRTTDGWLIPCLVYGLLEGVLLGILGNMSTADGVQHSLLFWILGVTVPPVFIAFMLSEDMGVWKRVVLGLLTALAFTITFLGVNTL